jgi:hypothetical protein
VALRSAGVGEVIVTLAFGPANRSSLADRIRGQQGIVPNDLVARVPCSRSGCAALISMQLDPR